MARDNQPIDVSDWSMTFQINVGQNVWSHKYLSPSQLSAMFRPKAFRLHLLSLSVDHNNSSTGSKIFHNSQSNND